MTVVQMPDLLTRLAEIANLKDGEDLPAWAHINGRGLWGRAIDAYRATTR